MSFSAEIKAELISNIPAARHCQLAELAAFIYFAGQIVSAPAGRPEIKIISENKTLKRKYFTLLAKAFNIEADTEKILQAIRVYRYGQVHDFREGISSLLLKNNCCRRAYLRGAFICIGAMSDPRGGYHLEFALDFSPQAEQLKEVLGSFALEARITRRKKYFIVYLKEGAGIVDLLNIMGAHNALLKFENLRVEKEVRGSVNRKVNCEAANISKTVTAASRQIEDITYIKEHGGFAALPDNLRQMAEIRLKYPDASLAELGELLNPPVGKSGVNHRLRKLGEISLLEEHKNDGEKGNNRVGQRPRRKTDCPAGSDGQQI